jgi:thiamine-phosphate pyrophosphorylase
MHPQLHGLYAITDPALATENNLQTQVKEALEGGARIIQYRDKSSDGSRRRTEAEQLQALCKSHGALFIINDDLALAASIQADGLHLGRDDADLNKARRVLGPKAIIGISCYNELQRARQAQTEGVDYVAFGRFFPSNTKPQAIQAEIELLQQAKQELEIPIVAIGGITPENGAPLVQAGADMLAVIQGVFAQSNIRRACQEFAKLFEDTNQ